MFPDDFVPNLAFFVAGLVTAAVQLRTGRIRLGTALLTALWLAADAALLARFIWERTDLPYLAALLAMQATAALSTLMLAFAAWRRRWSRTAKQSRALYERAFAHYLRGELEPAGELFLRLCRCDPWDAASWVALGNVQRRRGLFRRARSCYRRARSLDRRSEYGDFIAEQNALLRAAADSAPAPRSRRR